MEKDKQGRASQGGSSCVGANLFKVELRVFNSPLWSMVPVPVPATATAAHKIKWPDVWDASRLRFGSGEPCISLHTVYTINPGVGALRH
jgi:hypothetical protein